MKRDPRYFNVNRHTKICSEHFTSDDFINPYSSKKRLKADAVPSIFSWNKDMHQILQSSNGQVQMYCVYINAYLW